MIQIQTRLNVGGVAYELQAAYDNKSTVTRVLKKLAKDGTHAVTRTVEIAQKTVTLIYHV